MGPHPTTRFILARKFILAERLQRVRPLGVDNITASIFVDAFVNIFVEFLRVFDLLKGGG